MLLVDPVSLPEEIAFQNLTLQKITRGHGHLNQFIISLSTVNPEAALLLNQL